MSKDPKIIFIEEEDMELESHHNEIEDEIENVVEYAPHESQLTSDFVVKFLEQTESKILKKIDTLETQLMKQNTLILQIFEILQGNHQTSTEKNDDTEIEPDLETVPKLNGFNSNRIKCKRKFDSINEEEPIREIPAEPEVVESYEEEFPDVSNEYEVISLRDDTDQFIILQDQPLSAKILASERTSCNNKNEVFQFPFTTVDEIRKFNKSLSYPGIADEFVKNMKIQLDANLEDVTQQILRSIISEEILIESTWASKASGKLRISYLTNFLKCCLRLGLSVRKGFNLQELRAKTIDLIHDLRVENGLAPPSKGQRSKSHSKKVFVES